VALLCNFIGLFVFKNVYCTNAPCSLHFTLSFSFFLNCTEWHQHTNKQLLIVIYNLHHLARRHMYCNKFSKRFLNVSRLWLGIDTSVKCCGIKLVLSAQTFNLSETMRPCKCFPHVCKMLGLTYNWVDIIIKRSWGLILNFIYGIYIIFNCLNEDKIVSFITLMLSELKKRRYWQCRLCELRCSFVG